MLHRNENSRAIIVRNSPPRLMTIDDYMLDLDTRPVDV